jgi:hypothetical protein
MGKIATAVKVSINRRRSPSPSGEVRRGSSLSGRDPGRASGLRRGSLRASRVPRGRGFVRAAHGAGRGGAADPEPCGQVREACAAGGRAACRAGLGGRVRGRGHVRTARGRARAHGRAPAGRVAGAGAGAHAARRELRGRARGRADEASNAPAPARERAEPWLLHVAQKPEGLPAPPCEGRHGEPAAAWAGRGLPGGDAKQVRPEPP